jgi:hypothetical protein
MNSPHQMERFEEKKNESFWWPKSQNHQSTKNKKIFLILDLCFRKFQGKKIT